MKRHWSKFFWADWESDEGLRQCSLAAQGLWMRMLCICAKGEPPGYLTIAGNALDATGVARAVGHAEAEVLPLMAELERWGVFSRDRQDRIYSRRLVRDEQRCNILRKNGEKGGRPPTKTKHETKEETKTQTKPLASSSWPLASLEGKFEEFFAAYPKRDGRNPRKPAFDSFAKAVRGGADPDAIVVGARKYAAAEAKNVGTPYIAQAVTWLNQHCWKDYANGGGAPAEADMERAWAIKCERGKREGKPETAWGVPMDFIPKWKSSTPSPVS